MDYTNIIFIGKDELVEKVKKALDDVDIKIFPEGLSLAGIVAENGISIYPALPDQEVEGIYTCVGIKRSSEMDTEISVCVDDKPYFVQIFNKNVLDFYRYFISKHPGCRHIHADLEKPLYIRPK